MSGPESALSSAVAEMLRARQDVLLTRVEAGGEGRKRQTARGTADWCGVASSGRHLEIELKSPSGVRRVSQLQRERAVTGMRGVYAVCRTVQEVHDAIERAKRWR